ncbi:PREDICTED: AT-rich interactive domain-containing protein 2-like isoform X1 [Ipomoea nil]|uniref:AT-rich interactive domain-containing protein 2-like isoform X1 n=1 Tax=Ipomoea nil TaxID=35883 RepID=UPI0009010A29|nr:PREDICTED: AT-rich interactive domain-containing protein 2-like isoform X1 [Ipomoea nil]XP_019151683.1 PREDICTED: AT-rich interactive domain-containing protein 2-like isoform X1 [Ipomoea nil]
MEACSHLKDETTLDEDEIDHTSNWGNEFSLRHTVEDWVFDGCKKKLSCFFDQILGLFLKDVSKNRCFRPLPVMNGNGQEVNLFKLYSLVRRIGGYDAVSRENFWGFVAEQCGFGFGEIAFLKLTYIKYLNEFDQWIRQHWRESRLEKVESGLIRRLELLSRELEMKFRKKSMKSCFLKNDDNGDMYPDKGHAELDLLPVKNVDNICSNAKERVITVDQNNCDMNKDGGEVLVDVGIASVSDYVESSKKLAVKNVDKNKVHNNTKLIVPSAKGKNCCVVFDREQSSIDGKNDTDYAASAKKIVQKVLNAVPEFSQRQFDDDKKCFTKDNAVVTSAKNLIERVINKMHYLPEEAEEPAKDIEEIHTWKRKRAPSCFSGMLDWVTNAAKYSDNPEIGKIPACSKWRDHSSNEFWVQVLLIREVLLNKKHFRSSSEESTPQKKLKMHPSMYDDDKPNHLSAEKTRCSKRILSLTKHDSCPCCHSCSATDNKAVSPQKGETETCQKERVPVRIELPATETASVISDEESTGREVSVGPLYQAEVPEWTGVICESDSKWLGTRMWPPEETKTIIESDGIGKGRRGRCGCKIPSSVQCIRFHTAENRYKLKLELGRLFHDWRFNRMGEEVSLSWTSKEEDKFKSLIGLHAATPNKFWNNAAKFFPSKTKAMLVSYYFNVFLIKRRSYQNRVTLNDIDSDDDEKEFGSVGGSLGHEAIHVPGSTPLLCTENKKKMTVASTCWEF